jgi:peroxiredoxin (alkyl hydroperoxide reductase subunit C)
MNDEIGTVLVGRKAPDFREPAVLANGKIADEFHFYSEIEGYYVLLFFYPLDFTFVCPSELISLNNMSEQFEEMGVKVIAVSIDSQFTHHAWRNTPIHKGGIGPVRYTMVADHIDHSICKAYGVEHPEAGVALRGAFIIDRQKVVRAQIVNDLPLGRNMNEIIRLVEALQFHEEHGQVCPVNWNKGKAAIHASPEGIAKFLAENAEEL